MYQKRGAVNLAGVAPNRGATTNLNDIELAATEDSTAQTTSQRAAFLGPSREKG